MLARLALCVAGFAGVMGLLLTADAAPATAASCLLVGEGAVEGHLLGVREGSVLVERGGLTDALALQDVREIRLHPQTWDAPAAPWRIWLDEAGPAAVSRIEPGAQPATVSLVGYGWTCSDLPLAALAAIASRAAVSTDDDRSALEEALADPPVGQDLLSVAATDRRATVSCALETIDADALVVVVGDARRRVGWDRLGWLVTAARPDGEGPPHRARLTDGSSVPLDSFEVESGVLTGSLSGAALTIDMTAVSALQVGSERYRYVSAMSPSAVDTPEVLGVAWPPRVDAAVHGQPLSPGGTTCARGIGVAAPTTVTFRLGGLWQSFHATIGIDAAAGERGAVIFRVLADGAIAYESPVMRGVDAPLTVAVDVSGAQDLALVADAAGAAPLGGDLADWGDARLVRGAAEAGVR